MSDYWNQAHCDIVSRRSRKYWADPKHREEQAARAREYWANPEHRVKHGKKMADYWADPENRARMRVSSLKRFVDRGDAYREKYERALEEFEEEYVDDWEALF